jgi:outer membrane protein assembly factor BamB
MEVLSRFCSAFIVSACLTLTAPSALAGDDWTQEGQGPGAAGFNASQTTLGPAELPALAERWKRNLDTWQQATPATVADGQVYLVRRIDDPVSTVRSQLMRLDLATGQTVWKARAFESFATPLVTRDAVVVAGTGIGNDAPHTPVRAFDRATGAPRWQYLLPGAGNTAEAPHLQDGVVYLAADAGDVVALDADTGAVRWTRRIDIDCCGIHGLALGERVVVVSINDGLVGLDMADGSERWRYLVPANRLVSVRPMVVGDTALAFDGHGHVHAVDIKTGQARWQQLAPPGDIARAMAPMASDGQQVYVLSGIVRPALSALDLASGHALWSVRPGAFSHGVVVSNGVLYVPNQRRILAFDPASGAALPMAEIKATTRWGDLSIAQGHLVISGGSVRAFAVPNR